MVTFSRADIVDLCKKLKLPQTAMPPGVTVLARDEFLLAVGILSMRLDYYRSASQEPVRASDPSFIQLNPAELGESV
jgi:hypothetical protein